MLIKYWLLNSIALFARPGEGEPGAADPPAGDNQPGAGEGDGDAGGGASPADGSDDAAGDGEGADGQDGGAPPVAAKPPVVPPAPTKDWRDKEIARKHTKLTAAQQRVADLEAENQTLRELAERGAGGRAPAGEEGDADPAARSPAPVDANSPVVQQAAQRLRAADKYAEDCNATFAAGAAAYKDKWEPALEQLKVLGGIDNNVMTEILATDDPAQTLFKMSSDPDTFHRVMELPPAKRMAELVKLGLPAPKPKGKEPSKAPGPVDTVGGRASSDANNLSDDLTDEQWYARRKAQKDAAWAAKQSGRAA